MSLVEIPKASAKADGTLESVSLQVTVIVSCFSSTAIKISLLNLKKGAPLKTITLRKSTNMSYRRKKDLYYARLAWYIGYAICRFPMLNCIYGDVYDFQTVSSFCPSGNALRIVEPHHFPCEKGSIKRVKTHLQTVENLSK